MLFKLSLKNIKKSFKDYAIYFLTLILGVAIFYVFNAIDSQEAMLAVNETKKEILELMGNLLGGVSVVVSIVLAFLVIYANKFLIKKRKKEFGVYMTLGMGKGHISKVLFLETLLIGLISLIFGLLLGLFLSQLMSIGVAKMFEVDMTSFAFTFSKAAMIKTIIYFGIMYLIVMILNVFSVSRYKLIDLITASKKNEKIKIKNPLLSILIFLISIGVLAFAYYQVTENIMNIKFNEFIGCIILGIVGTILFFYGISGFILRVVQANKKVYFKDLNTFVLRQINSKINTTVFSMSIICVLLFFTITIFSSAMSLNQAAKKDLKQLTPMDLQIKEYTSENEAQSLDKILTDNKINLNNLKDKVVVNEYMISTVLTKDVLGEKLVNKNSKEFKYHLDMPEPVMSLSDYNKVAKKYGNETFTLNDDEYLVVADYEGMLQYRNEALKNGVTININGKTYGPKFNKVKDGFIEMGANHSNTGIFIVPDKALENNKVAHRILLANYNANNEDQYKKIDDYFAKTSLDNNIFIFTKTSIYDSAIGIGAIVTFIGLYLGVIFLISSAAILALKELSDSSDNKERYDILRKIGADEKMINKSLFKQIGIFFLVPLALAIIHSIFGIKCAQLMLSAFGKNGMLSSIIMTSILIVVIYGGYFLLTYCCSKSIIKER